MKVEIDFFFDDPRFLGMTGVQRTVYLALWGWAVQKRRETLKPIEVDPKFIADRLRIDVRSVKMALGVCDNLALIRMLPDTSLVVVGVADKHPRLHDWERADVPPSDRLGVLSPLPLSSPDLSSPTKEDPVLSSDHVGAVPFEDIREAWNNVAAKAGCVKCTKLTDSRKRAIRIRWRDTDWRDQWLSAINLLPQRKFACGENDRGWRMDFDFFLKANTVTGILEGKYKGKPDAPPEPMRPEDRVH